LAGCACDEGEELDNSLVKSGVFTRFEKEWGVAAVIAREDDLARTHCTWHDGDSMCNRDDADSLPGDAQTGATEVCQEWGRVRQIDGLRERPRTFQKQIKRRTKQRRVPRREERPEELFRAAHAAAARRLE
jgi:hypothetical protein